MLKAAVCFQASGHLLAKNCLLLRRSFEIKRYILGDSIKSIRRFHHVTGDQIVLSQVMGLDYLRDSRLNKGLAFTLEERQALGIHGLQPARIKTQEEQLELCRLSIMRYKENLNKYLYLTELHDRNEKLFYRLLAENVETLMPIVYTPTVGLACQKFGLIWRKPRGLFITINDCNHIFDVIKNWPEYDVRAIVVTDGERILGLGDLGAYGMGIPVGKLSLYTALAGIKPHQCLPITLDVGTNNQKLLEDPLYIGLRQKRITGPDYDCFMDEFMGAVVKRYGQNTLIQFEDFGNHNAFRLLERYRKQYCTFNDDIQGTAGVALAGIFASQRITGKAMSENSFMFFGAGEAAIGIADLCVKAMVNEGVSLKDARKKIWMMDVDGLLVPDRKDGNLDGPQKLYAQDHAPSTNLVELIRELKPSVLIGASTAGGAFNAAVLRIMAENNERPVVFALSNPTDRSECTAQAAYEYTQGRVIFASGSPMGNVEYNGVIYKPGQGNNAYIFPGVALGVLVTGMHHINEDIFLLSAKCVADTVEDDDLAVGRVYPPLTQIRDVSLAIATEISQYAYDNGLATFYPEPENKRQYIESQLYSYFYESAMPVTWCWPDPPKMKVKPLTQDVIKAKP